MPLIQLVMTLIVIGVLLWLLNTYGAQFIDGKILQIINVVVVIFVVLWLVSLFLPALGGGPRIGMLVHGRLVT